MSEASLGAAAPRLRLAGLCCARAGPFDLALPAGACLAITGPSGAGKSVLLRMIADLDPHDGEAWLDGRSRAAMRGHEWRRQVVYSAAESGWWLDTVGAHFAAIPAPEAARLGLPPDIFGQPVSSCSTGERQRLALLRAVARRPPVLLLDEPTGALDPHAVAQAEALIRQLLADGTTVIMVSHDPAQADRLGTVRGHLDRGRLAMAAR